MDAREKTHVNTEAPAASVITPGKERCVKEGRNTTAKVQAVEIMMSLEPGMSRRLLKRVFQSTGMTLMLYKPPRRYEIQTMANVKGLEYQAMPSDMGTEIPAKIR